MNIKKIILFSTLSFFAFNMNAQVTIGSPTKPVDGALLQLKETNIAGDAANSQRGLGMPRVKLTILTDLDDVLTAAEKAADIKYKDTHIGLMVYHTDKCTMLGNGLYVWSGTTWVKLSGDQTLVGLNTSIDELNFPSGQDLQTLLPQTFTVSWAPSEASTIAPTWALTSGDYTALNFATLTPASGSLTTSPQTMTVLPQAMTANDVLEVGGNPFMTRDRKLEYTFDACGNQKKIINITQTNKALLVNNSTNPDQILYAASATNRTFTVKSNAIWKASLNATTALSNLLPAMNTLNGQELKNVGQELTQKYDITIGDNLTRYSVFTFSDSESPKRFKDVNIIIAQCGATQEMDMDDWALIHGEAEGVSNAYGVQWHKDHENNVFFSNDFGTVAGRWMISNLATTTYGDRTTGGAKPANPANNYNPVPTSVTASSWAYPNIDGNNTAGGTVQFNNRQRYGLLYTWRAATGGENLATLDQGGVDHAPVQGICPKGWHLASDYEWTLLANEIQANTNKYASQPNIGGAAGGAVAKPMLDACEPVIGFGTSNSILNGGFSVLRAGFASAGKAGHFNDEAFFWTSSIWSGNSSWLRYLQMNSPNAARLARTDADMFSVRCKKD